MVFLNGDTPEDQAGYSGGSLIFYGLMDDDASAESVGLPLAGEAGLLVAFPPHVIHSVSPVTAGERYTVVTWFVRIRLRHPDRVLGRAQLPPMTAVSVIIPVHNGEQFIADAVESVLAQRDVSVETIVVDDGSTDGTPEQLAAFAEWVDVHRQERRGVSAARNTGVALAQGELLVFLDADDVLPPHYLARFVAAAAAAPQADVFHCGWRGIDLAGRVLYGQDDPFDLDGDPFHTIAAEGSPPVNALAVRRAAANRAGPWDENEHDQEDLDYWLRLAASGAPFQAVPGNVAIVRRHDQSWTAVTNGTAMVVSGLAVLERALSEHERCPACVQSDKGLLRWRRAVLRTSAHEFSTRLHLTGSVGRWIGASLAVARRPRLASTTWRTQHARTTSGTGS